MKSIRYRSRVLDKILEREGSRSIRLVDRVSRIIKDVRTNGDSALIKYARQFDKVKLSSRDLIAAEDEINGCYQDIKPEFSRALRVAIENVRRFYKRKIKKNIKIRAEEGVHLSERIRPLENVGVYVPAGTAPLISTVYMTVIPAQCAGVENIYIVTPPNQHKSVDPHILAAANLLKVKGIYKAGGAQAIAAMAFGTKTIPQMDKIVGPGNQYVAEAKRQVFGYCDIDMIAGPTELVVLANDSVSLDYIAADMKAQAEHLNGTSILITSSKKMHMAAKRLQVPGFVIKVKNMNQGVDLVNRIAPEHLQIMVKSPERLLQRVRNAGAVFLGPYSPTAIGDYIAGPSHVLPTHGSARFFSGLGVADFLRTTHVISYTRRALEKVRHQAEYIADLEGLTEHRDSIAIRFKQ